VGKFVVSNQGEYQSAWVSYIATVCGILKAIGVPTDLVDVAGYTGHAFLVNVSNQGTCPSGPTAHQAHTEAFPAGIEALGWKTEFSWDIDGSGSYPMSKPPSAADSERAKQFFSIVQNSLKVTGRPIGLWGIPPPEYGIVNGFDGDDYIVSTFRSLEGVPEPDDPVKFDSLDAPGGLCFIVFNEEVPIPDDSKRDKTALERAIRMADGYYSPRGYTGGAKAFEKWAFNLESHSDVTYHGNSYVSECVNESLHFAAEFLQRLATRNKEQTQGMHLDKGAVEYRQAAETMKEFTEIFPFAFEGDINEERRRKGASILRRVAPHVSSAIHSMKESVSIWE
jgi:hypothetical protein